MNWMQRALARSHDEESGMTLIEVMIVILILGVLSAIVVLGVSSFTDTGNTVSCKATADEFSAAGAAAYAKNTANNTNLGALYTGWETYLKGGSSTNKWSLTLDNSSGAVTPACPT